MNKHVKYAVIAGALGGAYNLTLNKTGTNKFGVFWGAVAVGLTLSFVL